MFPTFLTPDEQDIVIDWLLRGASELVAVRQAGRTYDDYVHTHEYESAFRRRCDAVADALARNVQAALYKAAMEGSVPAQTNWLRNYRSDRDSHDSDKDDGLSVEEIEQLLAAKGFPIPAESDPDVGTAEGADEPPYVPTDPEPHE